MPFLHDPKLLDAGEHVVIHSLRRTISETEALRYMLYEGMVETGMIVWPLESLKCYT